jgi:hypothetical protein
MTSEERKDRGNGERAPGEIDIERELGRLAPAAAPPGLRARVLDRAAAARRGAVLPPWMRLAAAACSVLIAALLAFDPLLNRYEESRLAALLDGPAATAAPAEIASDLAELGIGQGTEAGRWARAQDYLAAVARKTKVRGSVLDLERLKGWWDYETPEDPD